MVTAPPPMPPKKSGGAKYVSPAEMSCKSGGAWSRPGGNVPATEEGVDQCAQICRDRGFKYFGLECPGRLGGE